ncbi:hypothetical protein AC1031_019282 [Aphanomyces cochlioides]|nr:hypothetical protein AC1031_019282 [Aphanomyces cochlioides]
MDAVLDAKQRMDDIAAELRQRDAERERLLQNKRLARRLAGVKAQPSPSASTAPSPSLDNGYCNECAQAALSLGTRIGIRPIGTCLDAKAKSFAAMMHFGRDAVSISNQEWTEYFQHALNYHGPDFGDLEAKIRTTVVMDEKELDRDRGYDKWVYAYWSLLDKNNMISFHTKHPKNAVKALVEGVRPASLRAVVKNHLELDQKHLRNSVLQFMAFVKTKLTAQLEFTRAAKANGLVKVSDDANPKAKALSHQKGDSGGIGAAAQAKQKAVKCWSCGGPHHIAKCESTSDADKSTIRAKHAESKRTNGESGVSSDGKSESKGVARIDGKAESKKGSVIFKAKALQWSDCPPRDGSCWAVVIHGGLDEPVPALLDSGCDSGLVVSQGLAERLSTTSNLDLPLTVLPNPQVMEGFGGVPLTLSRHLVVPELALLVGDTPILLTSVSAWVDDTDPALAITVGRPIMKVLGYSTEGLLRNAAASPSVYDMGHLSVLDHDTSALCRALRAQRAHLDADDDAKDDFDDDEGRF